MALAPSPFLPSQGKKQKLEAVTSLPRVSRQLAFRDDESSSCGRASRRLAAHPTHHGKARALARERTHDRFYNGACNEKRLLLRGGALLAAFLRRPPLVHSAHSG